MTYPVTIENAVFDVETHIVYGHTDYDLTLVSGAWPSDAALLDHFGAIPQCGGGDVKRTSANTATVLIWGCD